MTIGRYADPHHRPDLDDLVTAISTDTDRLLAASTAPDPPLRSLH